MAQGHKSTSVRKKQIMDAARKLIMRAGSEHVTVRNMAKEVGISEAAIYRHFKSKTEILSFLTDSVADGLLHDIDTAGSVGFTSVDIIDEILRTHLSRIEQRRGLSFLVLAEIISFGDKSLNKKVSDNIQIYVDRLRAAPLRRSPGRTHQAGRRPGGRRIASFRYDSGPGQYLGSERLQIRSRRKIFRAVESLQEISHSALGSAGGLPFPSLRTFCILP